MLRQDLAHPAGPDAPSLAGRVALFASVAMFLPLLWPMVSGRVFARDDLGQFHLPMRHFYSKALAEGDDPRWHPGLFCGFYLHGEGQVGMAHPAHALLYRVLPLATAFQVEATLGYPLAFLGMIFWLRRLGLGADAATYGALSFAGSTFFLLRYVHMNAVEVFAHVPWLLLGIECLARPRSPRGRAWAGLGIALLTASQGLLGYPQYVGFSLIAEGLYAAIRLGGSGRDWVRLAVAKALGGLAAGAQLLPLADALAGSWRAKPTPAFLGICSLHPLNLLQVVAPTAFRRGYYLPEAVEALPWHEAIAYLGAATPTACAWLWIRRRDLGRWRPLVLGAAASMAGAMVLALGKYSPVFAVYARLPVAKLFRAPSRYVIVAQLAASLLVAIAFADLAGLIGRGEVLPRRRLWPLLGPAAVSVLAGLALVIVAASRPSWLHASQVGSVRNVFLGAAVIGLPASAFAIGARGVRWAPVALAALAAADTATFAIGPILAHETPVSPLANDENPAPPATADWFRIAAPGNEGWGSQGRLVRGYVALTPRRSLNYSRPEVRALAGVAWEKDEPGDSWRPAPLPPRPRAWLASRAVVSRNPVADLATIDPANTALVPSPMALPEGPTGIASMTEDHPGRIRVTTTAEVRRLLIVSEAHHSGWRVELDGRKAETIRVDGDFLGCVVPPGRHEVAFRFDPASDRQGRWLSGLGLVLIVALATFDLARRAGPRVSRIGRLSRVAHNSLTSAPPCDEMRGPVV